MMLIAKKSMRYAGRSLEPGDTFEAYSDRDARILQAIGKAETGTAPTETATPPVAAPKGRKGYQRRDMKAEADRG